MRRRVFQAAAFLALLVCAPAQSRLPHTTDAFLIEPEGLAPGVEDALAPWPDASRGVARAIIAKYGSPSRFDEDELVWLHNFPWEKTVVHRDGWPRHKDAKSPHYLRQVIGYRVPREKLEPILRFDSRVEIDPTTNELAALSDSERTNFLLVNLADDIVTEKRTAADARDFYARTLQLADAGKSSPYLDGLLFDPPNERTVTP